MERKIRISIVIPAYNVEGYIKKTIDSCLNQTFDDYEIIVVDDGSKDNTGAIIDKYATENRNVRAIHQENGGVMSARLKGVEHSQGEWVTFLDGDDRLPTNSLDILYNTAIDNNVDLVWGVRAYIDEDNNILNKERIRFVGRISNSDYIRLISKKPKSLHGLLYKKTLLMDPIVIDRRIVNNEDQIFNLFLSGRIESVYGIKNVVHYYLVRNNSVSKQKYDESYWYFLFSYLRDNYKRYGVNIQTYNRYVLNRLYTLLRSKKEYIFNFNHECFDNLKDINVSSYLNFQAMVALFLLKKQYVCLRNILKFHPRSFFRNLIS